MKTSTHNLVKVEHIYQSINHPLTRGRGEGGERKRGILGGHLKKAD